MIINVAPTAAGFLFQAAAGSDINFAADDRLDAFFESRFVKIYRAAENAVIRDRDGRELKLMRFVHQAIQTASAIEQRVLGVQVQMDEVGVRHKDKLPLPMTLRQGRDVHRRGKLNRLNRLSELNASNEGSATRHI